MERDKFDWNGELERCKRELIEVGKICEYCGGLVFGHLQEIYHCKAQR